MKNILFLAHRTPFPPDRGDKIRSYNVLEYLAARARMHLVAFADDPADYEPPAALRALTASCTILPRVKTKARATAEALATGRPVSLAAFDSAAMRAAVAQVSDVDAVYCFSGQMAQHLPADGPPLVMDFVDVDSAKFAQLVHTAALPLRWLLRREARRLATFEQEVAARAAASLFVTEAEAALFRRRGGAGRVAVVENGIDAAFFDPRAVAPVPEAVPLIVFTGQMDYAPNVDAARWFAQAVLPKLPGARFAIVGRAPTTDVQALAGPDVIVTGTVADVRPWLAAASVCVAPLRLARGVQNKVLEAMAMARPVVASPEAAQGIDHGGTVTVADGVDAWVEAVRAALTHGANDAARARVLARYGWNARLAPLDALLGLERPVRVAA